MPTVDVIDLNNSKVGEVELSDVVFGAEVNQDLLYESVRHYLAGTRAGTHKVKTRHEVAGSGKKLWKQKGTGRARMGSVRSPIWRHGGTVHGPVPRDYSYKLPRKMHLGALGSALSAQLRDAAIKNGHKNVFTYNADPPLHDRGDPRGSHEKRAGEIARRAASEIGRP